MQSIVEFLSSPVWQGIQGLLALIAIVLTFVNPWEWLEKHKLTSWMVRIPWIWLFIIGGIVTSIAVGMSHQNLYQGLSGSFLITTIGACSLWIKSSRSTILSGENIDILSARYENLTQRLRQIIRLQQTKLKLNDWKISYSIDDEGNGSVQEEFTIITTSEPIYFFVTRYGLASDVIEEPKVSGKNLLDDTPLSIFEIEHSRDAVDYLIILFPPSTKTEPIRISLRCERKGIWSNLAKHGEDEGFLLVPYPTNSISLEINAPPHKKWKSLHPAPSTGEVKIESSGSISRLSWIIQSPKAKRYAYRIFLEG